MPEIKESSLRDQTQEENMIATTDQSMIQGKSGLP